MNDNLLSKLTRLHIEESSFIPEGQTTAINYLSAVLSYELNGKPKTMRLKINGDKAQILELADTQNATL